MVSVTSQNKLKVTSKGFADERRREGKEVRRKEGKEGWKVRKDRRMEGKGGWKSHGNITAHMSVLFL